MCMAADNCKLQERVDAIDERVTRLERNMTTGFAAVTNAVAQTNDAVARLATDFGKRMNNLDAKIIEEKAKWGDSFRKWLDWIVRLLIFGCGAAMGMTAYKIIFGN